MNDKRMPIQTRSRSLLCGLALALFLTPAAFSAAGAAPAVAVAPAPLADAPTPCELPPVPASLAGSLGMALEAPGFPPLPAPDAGVYDLYITCFSVDRTHYPVGSQWSGTLVVLNVGSGPSPAGSISVTGRLCRRMQSGGTMQCAGLPDPLVAGLPALEPGESLLIAAPAMGFDVLPDDPSPGYENESALAGIPDHGTVYIRAVLGSVEVSVPVVYPAGPEDLDPSAPGFVDEDGDGWPAPPPPEGWMGELDCDDSNPEINPWHPEVLGNGPDDDCSGGDVPEIEQCPGVTEIYHDGLTGTGECDLVPPGTSTGIYQNVDGDAYADYDPDLYTYDWLGPVDCNDLDDSINPGEPERLDGIDNNCNNLVDEGFATPDWVIDGFSLTRVEDFENPDWYWLGLNPGEIHPPGLQYSVQIGNAGQDLGDDLSAIQTVTISIPFVTPLQVVAVGTEGFIPYNSLPDSAEYACGSRGLVAQVTGGIYGETQTGNNIAVASLAAVATPDRDLRFSTDQAIGILLGQTAIGVLHAAEAVGSCPALPQTTRGDRVFQRRVRVILNDQVLADSLLTSGSGGQSNNVALPADLERGDLVCVEVTLDPDRLVTEIDRSNNMAVRVYEYRNPLLGPPRFDLLEAVDGPPGAVDYGPGGCNPPAEAGAALSSGGGWVLGGGLLGLVLLGLGGLLGGRWIVRATGLGGRLAGLFLAGAALTGAAAGLLGGAALVDNLYVPRPATVFAAIQPADEASRPPACDTILDPAGLLPPDGAAFAPYAADLVVHLASLPGSTPPDRYLLRVSPPEGDPLTVPLPANAGVADLRLGEYVYRQGGHEFFTQAGEYRWEVVAAQVRGPDEGAYLGLCQGSQARSFAIDPALAPVIPTRTPTPTNTPTPTSRPVPPTPTFTPVPQDTAGPGIKNVSDAPDPVYAGAPKGCTLTTTVVSAAIGDPSGVQSAVVIFIGASAGSVPMTLSAGMWRATLGPFPAAGTVNYQIRAYDTLGNRSDTAFFPLTVLACIP